MCAVSVTCGTMHAGQKRISKTTMPLFAPYQSGQAAHHALGC